MSSPDDIYTQVEAILEEADELDYGPERIAKAEEAVRLADDAKHDVAGFEARLGLIQAAVFGGWPEKGLVAFGWCVAKTDADPTTFPESRALPGFGLLGTDLLWVYKWGSPDLFVGHIRAGRGGQRPPSRSRARATRGRWE